MKTLFRCTPINPLFTLLEDIRRFRSHESAYEANAKPFDEDDDVIRNQTVHTTASSSRRTTESLENAQVDGVVVGIVADDRAHRHFSHRETVLSRQLHEHRLASRRSLSPARDELRARPPAHANRASEDSRPSRGCS